MADLSFDSTEVDARVRKTLTYHKDLPAGAVIEAELGDDKLEAVVPAGKTWNVQVSFYITETDA